jgi:hypothetical protein
MQDIVIHVRRFQMANETKKTRESRFAVVREDNGPHNPYTSVVSNHHTAEAAHAAIEKANRSLRRLPGYERAWHPYAVLDRISRRICRGGEQSGTHSE